MPATIQGLRPDPRIHQTQLAELQRIYGEVVRQQQGAIVFLAGEPESGRRTTLQALREALRENRSHPTVIAGTLAGGAYAPVAMPQKDYDQAMDVLGNLLAMPALFVDPVFGPILGLVAHLLQLGAVSPPFIQ